MAVDPRTRGRQLTLFPQPKPTDEHRWPRGYTPERMAALRDIRTPLFVVRKDSEGSISGENNPGHPLATTGAQGAPEHSFHGPAGYRRVREAIARSGTPIEDFTDKTKARGVSIYVHPAPDPDERAAGFYRKAMTPHDVSHISLYAPRPDTPPEEWARQEEETLMHELGHHRSFLAGTDEWGDVVSDLARNAPNPRTAQLIGREEARADENVQERYVPHPKDPDRTVSRESAYSAGPDGFQRAYDLGSMLAGVAHAEYNRFRGRPADHRPDRFSGYALFDQDGNLPSRQIAIQQKLFDAYDEAGFPISHKHDEDPEMVGDRAVKYVDVTPEEWEAGDRHKLVPAQLGDPELESQGPMDTWRRVGHYTTPDPESPEGDEWHRVKAVDTIPTRGRGRRPGTESWARRRYGET